MKGRQWLLVMGIWCLVLAAVSFPAIWVYQLTRWAVCAAAIYAATQAKGNWKGVFIAMAVAFNPILPIHFGREAWRIVDALAGVAFIWYLKVK